MSSSRHAWTCRLAKVFYRRNHDAGRVNPISLAVVLLAALMSLLANTLATLGGAGALIAGLLTGVGAVVAYRLRVRRRRGTREVAETVLSEQLGSLDESYLNPHRHNG